MSKDTRKSGNAAIRNYIDDKLKEVGVGCIVKTTEMIKYVNEQDGRHRPNPVRMGHLLGEREDMRLIAPGMFEKVRL